MSELEPVNNERLNIASKSISATMDLIRVLRRRHHRHGMKVQAELYQRLRETLHPGAYAIKRIKDTTKP